jgi:hypothetical protein
MALALLAFGTPRAQPGFRAPLSFDAGPDPLTNSAAVAVADFNGDGILDLAVGNGAPTLSSPGTVSILLGKGDGTFRAAADYATRGRSHFQAVADFNGDGIPDLAFVDDDGVTIGTVNVLLGNGDGTFQAGDSYLTGAGPVCVAVADFSGDGILDLAVVNNRSHTVSIWLGNSDGTFQAAQSYPVGTFPWVVVVGDFNGDGISDLAVSNTGDVPRSPGSVSVLLGNGDGSFQAAVNYAAGPNPVSVAVGDLNGDGILDLAVGDTAETGAGSVRVLLGKGDGSFQAGRVYALDSLAASVAVRDLNGDGVLDLAVSTTGQHGGGSVSVLLGNGDATFQAAQRYAVGSSATYSGFLYNGIAVGDFNGDGMPDFAVANGGGNVSVLLGMGGGSFQAAPSYGAGSTPVDVAVTDLNGDGIADLAVADQEGTASILLGNADGTFQAAVAYPVGGAVNSVAVADFNGDGIPDLALANADQSRDQSSVSVLLGNGNGTFRAAVRYAAGPAPSAVAVGDFNRDGVADLVLANNVSGGTVSVLLGKGDGTFQAAVQYTAGNRPSDVAVGDFNGDGIPDLVVANAGNSNGTADSVQVLLGKGDGTFQAGIEYAAGSSPTVVRVGDFNGDGIADLAVANALSHEVSVLLGKGNGTFQAAVAYAVGPHAGGKSSPAVKDFNGDGIADLAVVFGGGVRVLLGKGDGSFQTTAISYLAGVGPVSVAAGDFNSDGLPDLAVSNRDSNNVSILFNDGQWVP